MKIDHELEVGKKLKAWFYVQGDFTLCEITRKGWPSKWSIGTGICKRNPSDSPDPEVGRALSLYRALKDHNGSL